MAISKKTRKDIEVHVCKFFDALDPSGINTDYVKEKFARMSDTQFEQWLKKKYPLQFQMRTFETEPTFSDYENAAKVVGINLLEPVALPYLYTNKDGVPVNSKPALITYLPIKRVQQMHTIKNHVSLDTDRRDPKSGRLLDESKSAQTSDREFESLEVMGLDNIAKEMSTIRADALDAKSQAYNQIMNTGSLSQKDYEVSRSDSVAKNTISTYLLAAHIDSNLVNQNGYTPYTLRERSRKIEREN